MTTSATAIADAVVDLIEAIDFSPEVEIVAARSHLVEFDRSELATSEYRVDVVPVSRSHTRLNRGTTWQREAEVLIHVRCALSSDEQRESEIDAAQNVMDAIRGAIEAAIPLGELENVSLAGIEETLAQTDKLDQMNQFAGSLLATFRYID